MDYTYRTKGTCSREISFELDGDRVKNVHFVGALPGKTAEQIEAMLRGNTCGPRPTSCADQLAIAVQEAYKKEQAGE